MKQIKPISWWCFIGLALLSSMSATASNFVCGQDLDGNGDVTGSGETTSCTKIGNQQFCSIGALSCNSNINTQYQCSIDNKASNNQDICSQNCYSSAIQSMTKRWSSPGTYYWKVPDGVTKVNVSVLGGKAAMSATNANGQQCGFGGVAKFANVESFGSCRIFYLHGQYSKTFLGYDNFCCRIAIPTDPVITNKTILVNPGDRIKITIGTGKNHYTHYAPLGGSRHGYRNTQSENGKYVSIQYSQPIRQNGSCLATTNTTHTCPVAGNSCVNNNGIQQCSPNKCIDLDVTPAVETNPPPVTAIDNGTRNIDGACMDQALMFTGRNLSCKKSGFTKNCCKDTGVVFNDSTGSHARSIVKDQAIKATFSIISAAYVEYSSLIASGAGAEMAATGASWAAEGAISSFGVDPYSIAISIAIQVVTKMISCGQEDTEAAMLNGSGYCHLVGEYCSKKWPLVGCVVKSESHCCFNSKLARIIQQQGRVQMGKSWGSPESPSCGGFTPDQFQALDFSKIDMSEYYEDIKAKGESLIQQNISSTVSDYYNKIGKDYAQ